MGVFHCGFLIENVLYGLWCFSMFIKICRKIYKILSLLLDYGTKAFISYYLFCYFS